ncbi:MAG: IS200/IS605 family accessory protein TnpB-related protein [Firmicutes bacterium]|nr:IS200/IS605 family accessory protein TnpB-related protein [Bacillota bacterium]
MEKTYFSNRVYKNTLPTNQVYSTGKALIDFNRAKHKAYRMLLAEHNYGTKHDPSVHLQVKELFSFDDYWANSAVQEARAQISSQKELLKMYSAGVEDQIDTKRDKIKELNKKISRLEDLLSAIIKGKFKTWRGSNIVKHDSGIISVDFKKKSLVFFNTYDFEHQYLRPEIKSLKNRVKLIKYSLTRLEEKLKKLQSGFLKGCVFGTKDLFKKQFTVDKYKNNHELWLEEWRKARYSSLRISGRLDAKYGNFVFKYDVETKVLTFSLPDGTTVNVPVVFKYGQEEVDAALIFQKDRRKPIAWAIEDHGEYYIFKVTVDVPENPYVNYYKGDGVIGLDMNYDHAALSETDRYGNLVDWSTVPYNLDGLTKGQAIKVLEQAAIDIVNIAKLKKKPIVIEDLDTTDSKFRLKYGSKKRNRKITLFAYRALTNAILARADKEGVAVFKVKPAYTSVAGKVKYMARKGIPIHVAAALVIARRGMGFKEKVPPVLSAALPEKIRRRHHWAHWAYLQRQVKGIRVHHLYRLGKELEGGVSFGEALERLKSLSSTG